MAQDIRPLPVSLILPAPLLWMRANLFSSPFNVALTLVAAYLVYISVPPFIQWAIIDATWSGSTRDVCSLEDGSQKPGACWVFVKVWFPQFMFGFYPIEERWRVVVAFAILMLASVPLFIPAFKHKGALGAFLLTGYPVIAYILFVGGIFGLPLVETNVWGGLFVTLVVAGVGIVISLPMGVLLALGRRSRMPVLRTFCVLFIELWRGVPLITVLFMAAVMFPLFLPEGTSFDKLLRVLLGVAFFSAAYLAEVVRGGLQAITKGQTEAAQALGLGYWRMMRHIVLPQALRIVIPGIVNSFIGLFKDTTLVLIIGLFDILGMTQAARTNPNWLGFSSEGYVFAAAVFWTFCYGMSRYSQHMERRLSAGRRR